MSKHEPDLDLHVEQQREIEEEEAVRCLCPDCKAEVSWNPKTDSIFCTACGYEAPDTYFCEEEVHHGETFGQWYNSKD